MSLCKHAFGSDFGSWSSFYDLMTAMCGDELNLMTETGEYFTECPTSKNDTSAITVISSAAVISSATTGILPAVKIRLARYYE